MASLEWKEDLDRLVARLSAAGVAPDTSDMTLSEQWAVYCVLRRLTQGQATRNLRGGDE